MVCAFHVLIIVSYCLCLVFLWVDDDVPADGTYDSEVLAFVPGYELQGKLLLTCYRLFGFHPCLLIYASLVSDS